MLKTRFSQSLLKVSVPLCLPDNPQMVRCMRTVQRPETADFLKFIDSGFLNLEVDGVFFYSDCLEKCGFVYWNDVITDNLGLKNIILDFDPLECSVKKVK